MSTKVVNSEWGAIFRHLRPFTFHETGKKSHEPVAAFRTSTLASRDDALAVFGAP